LIRCVECDSEYGEEPPSFLCVRCGGTLELALKGRAPDSRLLFPTDVGLGVWRYQAALPLRMADSVTLGEGGTPLVHSRRIGNSLKLEHVFIKNEGQNPTGSFKDRGMTVAVARAVERGARVLLCASTGNTSASLAAYASRTGIRAVVLVPSGKVAAGKLVQAVAYGADVIRVKGGFDRALALAMEVASANKSFYLMNSVNPFRIEGQKTLAYEVYEQLGRKVPDYLFLPVGNAGNISAISKGFWEMKAWGITDKIPKMVGVQASGAAPIVEAFENGAEQIQPWRDPETSASAIRIGNPVSWRKALRAVRRSRGTMVSVSDAKLANARKALALREGIFVETASAASVAGLKAIFHKVGRSATVVCVATGSGLKEQETIPVDLGHKPLVTSSRSLLKLISS
jgi:threonine synthase